MLRAVEKSLLLLGHTPLPLFLKLARVTLRKVAALDDYYYVREYRRVRVT
jgi:hypothetical protein